MEIVKKSCLDCKYEPDWGQVFGNKYPRRIGICKWDKKILLPGCYTPAYKKSVVRYSDNSGICLSCPTWEPK